MESDRLDEELRRLKERLDRGEIDEADYKNECLCLLDAAGHTRPIDPFASDNYPPRRPTRLTDLTPDMEIGPEDNRFRLVREIGGGAMGQVWLAHDLAEEELEGGELFKALKVVNPLLQDSPRALEMLMREAVRASRLSHPNIINVYGWRQGRDGWLFVLMDYLEGRDLDRILLDEGTPGLSWKRTLELLKLVAAGLDYAHDQNIIHRDLKPGNVFITKEGEVKLLDFGLAYRLHRSSSMVKVQESSSSGTPEYMPPEAFAAGTPDKAQDIYALACISYEMLTGKLPYSREAAVRRSPDLMPGKPEALTEAAWEVLKSGLAYRKEDRPESAGELVRQLEAAQEGTPPPPPPPPKRWLVGSIVIMFLVVGLSYIVLRPNNSHEEPVETAQNNQYDEKAVDDDQSVEGSETVSLQESNDQSPEVLAEPEKGKVSKQPAPKPEEPPLQNIHGWPAEKVKALQQETAEALEKPVVFHDRLKDGSSGPDMVVIPPGEFLMGSPEGEEGRDSDERQHRVKIEQSFAMGKYEVTFAEYDRFAEATGRDKPDDEDWGRGKRPVINVSWNDAVAYAEWLSEQTGQKYRLPTEAEWEYAARAGTATPFHFGETISTDQANYVGNYGKTVEVGQFPPNAWGLHDVHGNVWEWTCSVYNENYEGAEQECASKDHAGLRVGRGASWDNRPRGVRSAIRGGGPPGYRYGGVGFRLARSF